MSPRSVKLTKAQWEWLSAFRGGPPVEMAWLDAEHRDVFGGHDTWVYLSAWWSDGRSASIHRDDRGGLSAYFDAGSWSLSPAGLQALNHQEGEP